MLAQQIAEGLVGEVLEAQHRIARQEGERMPGLVVDLHTLARHDGSSLVQVGRRIATKQASATSAKAHTSASAAASDARSATKASTSGAADCMASHGPAIRPISRP